MNFFSEVPAFDMNKIQNLLNNIDAVEGDDDDEEVDENDPDLLSELNSVIENPMPGKKSKASKPQPAVQQEILVKSAPEPEPEPESSENEENIAKIKKLQIEYKRAALKAKTNNDKNAALTYLKVSKV